MPNQKLISFFIFFTSTVGLYAQEYPVTGHAVWINSTFLYPSEVVSKSPKNFVINLWLSDETKSEIRIRLRVKFEGSGFKLVTKPTFIGSEIILKAGVPLRLTGPDLVEYFNLDNLEFSGTTRSQFEKAGILPEGVYKFCFEVLDHSQGISISREYSTQWLLFPYPFQILYAENVVDKNGQTRKSQDMIAQDEILTVKNNGTVILIHYSGVPVEFEGDTTISIQRLNDHIPTSGRFPRPPIDCLFNMCKETPGWLDEAIGGPRPKDEWDNRFLLLYPPTYRGIVWGTRNEDLHLKWPSIRAFEVQLSDRVLKIIKKYTAKTTEITINKKDINYVTQRQVGLAMGTIGYLPNQISCHFNIVLPPKLGTTERWDLKKASQALVAGYYLELYGYYKPYIDEAEKYFKLATQLSEKNFYNEMLANFYKRKENAEKLLYEKLGTTTIQIPSNTTFDLKDVFTEVDVRPEFPGGSVALGKYLNPYKEKLNHYDNSDRGFLK